jgi:RNA polymerase sigma factor (sigma-70 family)
MVDTSSLGTVGSPFTFGGFDAATDHKHLTLRRVLRPTQTATVADLVDGCRTGDEQSWAELVARYESLVFNVARRNGLGRSDAADVTQLTFAKLLEQIHALRDVDRLSSWLGTVTRREAWRLAQKRRTEAAQELGDSDGSDDSMSALVAHWELREAVTLALAEIGSPCQELMHWLFLDPEPPSHAEIATRLGRAAGGVGPLRLRCLAKLRPLLCEVRND